MKKPSLLTCLLCCFAAVAQAQMKVGSLRVEHMENPSVVDERRPRLSWVNEPLDETQKGQRQTAYRIVVASSELLLRRGIFDLWDSGKVESDSSVLVSYGGRALSSGEDCYWKVCTWDKDGLRSRWSPVAHWGMGLLDPTDWKANWIAAGQEEGAPMFRKTFTLRRKVRKAKAYVTSGGYFELYVNGQRVGEDQLVPNFTNYTTREGLDKGGIALENKFTAYRVLYLAYDITSLLHRGTCAVGALLGDGFYRSTSYHVGAFGEPCLLCQIEVTYDDGSREIIPTDASWLTHPSPITLTGVYDGEVYDARLETPHWAEASLDESQWQPVRMALAPVGTLTAHTSPTDRITEVLSPVGITLQDSTFVIDFGKEIAGWVRLINIKGEAGRKVEVEYESESPQGKETYICKGSPDGETYAPRFTWFVFSKVRVKGLGSLTRQQIQAEAVNTDVRISSRFWCSNPLLNKINDIWLRSQLDNMHGCIASDCPHRERLPYTGDGQIASAMVMLNFDAAAFYQKWLRDMRDAQNPQSGYVPNGAPWQPTCGGGVAWGAAMNVIPWEYYLQYGDVRQLQLCYQPMRDQLRCMCQWLTPDGTMFQQMRNYETGDLCYWLNLGDWVPPYGNPPDEIVHTFYLWLCATNTAKAARVLGDEAGRQECEALAHRTWEAFHRKFYDPTSASYGDFGPNVLALYMGVPEDRRDAVVETLRHEIMDVHSGHINTGFVTSKFFFETLSDCGLHDVATTAMTRTDYPSFGHWIEQGATTTWEQWDGQNSHNHPMYGGGLTWLARRLAGVNVQDDGVGYRHFLVRPVPSVGIDTVFYSQQTPQGLLSSRVVSREGQLRWLEVKVPVGSTATICLPSATYRVPQGKYRFENK